MNIAKIGIAGVGVFFLVVLIAIAFIDGELERRGHRTIGQRLATWSRLNPWFAAVLAFVLGALLGHFFWPTPENPLQ
jgi:H+/Cl- antiporter ClcA